MRTQHRTSNGFNGMKYLRESNMILSSSFVSFHKHYELYGFYVNYLTAIPIASRTYYYLYSETQHFPQTTTV